MKRTALSFVLLALPVAALALDYQHSDDNYSDAPSFSVAEQAAISALTSLRAVSGNPDGSFAPDRTLNRAEFTKIALLSAKKDVLESDAADCFPDVSEDAWFSRYVCFAKVAGIVEGNPDGLFHPERSVNNAEATKILVELAGYDLPEPAENERWAWYTAYLKAADLNGVGLPGSIEPGHELTRGQMARLAAAFVAWKDGSLEEYRNAERGKFGEASSSSVEEEESSSSISSSSSSSSRASSSSSRPLFPAKSSFLLTGKLSPLIISGNVTSSDEASKLRMVKFNLRREINSLGKVYLVEQDGDVIAELLEATNDNADHRKWEASVSGDSYSFAANTVIPVGIRFMLDPKDGGGSSNELVEIESFSIQAEGQSTGNTKYLLLDTQVFPMHQTAFGRMTHAKSVLPASGTMQTGTQKQIASVRFMTETATGGSVLAKSVEFLLETSDVNVSNLRIGDASKGQLSDCGLEKIGVTHVVCSSLGENGTWVPSEGLVVSLYADVALSGQINGQMNVVLESRGSIGRAGSFTWTDGSGIFNWLEDDVLFGGNVSWSVTH